MSILVPSQPGSCTLKHPPTLHSFPVYAVHLSIIWTQSSGAALQPGPSNPHPGTPPRCQTRGPVAALVGTEVTVVLVLPASVRGALVVELHDAVLKFVNVRLSVHDCNNRIGA